MLPLQNLTVGRRSDMKIITSKPNKETTVRPKRSSKPKKRAPRGGGSIYELPNGKWMARVRRFGEDVKRTCNSLADAVKELEVIKQAPSGNNRRLGKMLFSNWLERYRVEEAPKRKTKTRKLHEYYVSRVVPVLGHIPISSITPADLRKFQNTLLQ